MTLREINEWMERYAAAFQEGGFTPLQAVRLCSWHMTDKRDTHSGADWMRLTGEWVEFVAAKRTS